MRHINKVILFSNAAVQGLALDAKTFDPRQLKTAEGRKKFFAASFKLMTQGLLPALLFFAFNHSDDDRWKKYQNRPDWEKDTYWIIGDEDAAPSIIPTMVEPTFEVWANYSFFRDAPIVPFREQKLPARLQYDANTTTVAKIFGVTAGVSPRKIDYLVSGYLGRLFSGGTDEFPIARRFAFDPYRNPKIVKDYYGAYNKQEKNFSTATSLSVNAAKKVDLPDDYAAALHRRLKAAHETMSKISKREKLILEAPKLSSDERTKKLRELEQRRVALCEKVFQRAR